MLQWFASAITLVRKSRVAPAVIKVGFSHSALQYCISTLTEIAEAPPRVKLSAQRLTVKLSKSVILLRSNGGACWWQQIRSTRSEIISQFSTNRFVLCSQFGAHPVRLASHNGGFRAGAGRGAIALELSTCIATEQRRVLARPMRCVWHGAADIPLVVWEEYVARFWSSMHHPEVCLNRCCPRAEVDIDAVYHVHKV